MLCDVGEHDRGLGYLQRAVAKGYFAAPTLSGRTQFDALRSDPAFRALMEDAEAGRQRALAAFREAGGERLIGSMPSLDGLPSHASAEASAMSAVALGEGGNSSYTRSRAPLRRRAPFAWLTRCRSLAWPVSVDQANLDL